MPEIHELSIFFSDLYKTEVGFMIVNTRIYIYFLQSNADPHNLHKKTFQLKYRNSVQQTHNSNFCNYKYVTNITKTKHLINHGALVQFWQFVSYFFQLKLSF